MFHRYRMILCVFSLVLSIAGVAAATGYTFTALPPIGSDTMSIGFAMNQVNGVPEVAGRSSTSHIWWKNKGNAATFNSAGTETNIMPYIAGAQYGGANAIDTGGNVAGEPCMGTTGPYHAFYLASGSTSATLLPDLSATTSNNLTYSLANGMNASGQIVGGSSATDGNDHAVVWTESGGTWGVTDLGASGYSFVGLCRQRQRRGGRPIERLSRCYLSDSGDVDVQRGELDGP